MNGEIRELKQQPGRRLRKHHLKKELVLFQLHCFCSTVLTFNLLNVGDVFWSSIAKVYVKVHEKNMNTVVLCLRPS